MAAVFCIRGDHRDETLALAACRNAYSLLAEVEAIRRL